MLAHPGERLLVADHDGVGVDLGDLEAALEEEAGEPERTGRRGGVDTQLR